MLKKNEARAMVEKYNVEKETQAREKAIAFCDTQASEEIRKRAEKGKTDAKVSVPTDLDINIVVNYLTTQGGYTVNELTHTYLLIEW